MVRQTVLRTSACLGTVTGTRSTCKVQLCNQQTNKALLCARNLALTAVGEPKSESELQFCGVARKSTRPSLQLSSLIFSSFCRPCPFPRPFSPCPCLRSAAKRTPSRPAGSGWRPDSAVVPTLSRLAPPGSLVFSRLLALAPPKERKSHPIETNPWVTVLSTMKTIFSAHHPME